MTFYAGDPALIVVAAKDPTDLSPITDAVVTAELFEPGRNPKVDPGIRDDADEGPYVLLWDAEAVNRDKTLGAFTGLVDLTDFMPGRWNIQIKITRGGRTKISFSSFLVRP